MKRIALPIAARRTPRSLEVNAPSLNAGWPNRFVVAIPTPRPVSSSARLEARHDPVRLGRRDCPTGSGRRRAGLTPHAPSSASLCTESTGSTGARVGPPNGSRPGLPTVHRPNVKRCCGRLPPPRRSDPGWPSSRGLLTRCLQCWVQRAVARAQLAVGLDPLGDRLDLAVRAHAAPTASWTSAQSPPATPPSSAAP